MNNLLENLKPRFARSLFALAACLLLASCTGGPGDGEAADLIIRNGRITTLDDDRPEATAMAVSDGRVVAVGSDDEVRRYEGPDTQVLDLRGRRVIPGLNDSHLHVTRGGRFYNLELRWEGVSSLGEGLDLIRRQAERTPEGQWVRVIGGWSPYQFEEKRFPTIEELNEAAPGTPVFVLFLYSRGFLNQAGIEALGIDASTQPPAGARYEIGADGEPTGVLIADPNPTILYRTIGALPQLSADDQVNSTRQFYRELNRLGLTSAIDAGGGGHSFPENYQATESLARQEGLPLRVSYYLFPQRPGQELEDFNKWISGYRQGVQGDRTRVNGYVLEGGGEFLVWSAGDFENFMAPRPDLDQRPAMRQELEAVARKLVENRWPFRIHATYDESITRILDVFEKINSELPFDGLRWAVDHAETISPGNIERIRALGGGIAVQSRMAFAGEYFLQRYGAEVTAQAPPLRTILDSGVPLGAGSDATRVSNYNPWTALYWLVSGKTIGGTQLYGPENRLSREEALRLYTVGSAWFSGEEDVKGRLAAGQYADFAVLADDYFSVAEEQIKSLESVLTVVGGDIVHASGPFAEHAPPLPEPSPEWSPASLQRPE